MYLIVSKLDNIYLFEKSKNQKIYKQYQLFSYIIYAMCHFLHTLHMNTILVLCRNYKNFYQCNCEMNPNLCILTKFKMKNYIFEVGDV